MAELKITNSLVDDRFEIVERKGQGSFAEIFLARDRADDRFVIVKALNISLQGTLESELEQTLVENFQNEATALRTVSHPNIIQLIGEGTAIDLNGLPFRYIVLEYMPGGDLLQKCKEQRLSLDQMMHYISQVCDALSHAHKCNVIHRDIKPNNMLLSEDRKTVKIADFGVAKIAPQAREELTPVGTEIYAAPEHHPSLYSNKLSELTPSADVYSLAKSIYTLVTGRAPLQFEHRPITEFPAEIMSESWGPGLLNLLRRATSTQIDQRYLDAESFCKDLKEVWVESQEITWVRASAAKAAGAAPAAVRQDLSRAKIVVPLTQKEESPGFVSLHSKKLLAVFAVLLILGIFFWGYSRFAPPLSDTQNTQTDGQVEGDAGQALTEEPAVTPVKEPKESVKPIKPKQEREALEYEIEEPVTKEKPNVPRLTPKPQPEDETIETKPQPEDEQLKDLLKEPPAPLLKELPKPKKSKELPKVVPREVPEKEDKDDEKVE